MKEFIILMEDLFEVSEGSISALDSFREYDAWDSLALLSLMALLEDEFNMTIPRDDFEKIITIEDLYVYVKSNNNG
jgi:acyl carrier protein